MTPELVLMYNQATELLNKKKYEKAIPIFKKVVSIEPSKEAWLNLGNCYRFLDQDTKAIECYMKSNDPKTPWIDGKLSEYYGLACNNIGLYHYCNDRNDEAIKWYDYVLEKEPTFHDAEWNKATAVLKKACSAKESYEKGWELYSARFKKTPPVELKVNRVGIFPWTGNRVDKLLVLAEQGIGDNIQWMRYIPELKKRVGEVFVQAEYSLWPMIEQLGVKCVFHTSECDADWAVPICELSKMLKVDIPDEHWFTWNNKHDFGEGFNIGIIFAGSLTHANNRNRSVNMHRFHRLAKYGNLYCISPNFKSTKYIKALPIRDWADTCSYLKGLDLLISVDTSVVHMAGTLGVETWMLQPLKETDFRWGDNSMGFSNPWYKSVKVFRNPNNWDHVFDQVEEALKEKLYLC